MLKSEGQKLTIFSFNYLIDTSSFILRFLTNDMRHNSKKGGGLVTWMS